MYSVVVYVFLVGFRLSFFYVIEWYYLSFSFCILLVEGCECLMSCWVCSMIILLEGWVFCSCVISEVVFFFKNVNFIFVVKWKSVGCCKLLFKNGLVYVKVSLDRLGFFCFFNWFIVNLGRKEIFRYLREYNFFGFSLWLLRCIIFEFGR